MVYTKVIFKGLGLHRTTKLERLITCVIKPCKLLATRAKAWINWEELLTPSRVERPYRQILEN